MAYWKIICGFCVLVCISNTFEMENTYDNMIQLSKLYFRSTRSAFSVKNIAKEKTHSSQEDLNSGKRTLVSLPRFALSKSNHIKMDPKQYRCEQEDDPSCMNKTKVFKEKILQELSRVRDESIHDPNFYNINYRKLNVKPEYNKSQAICCLIKVKVKALRKTKKTPFYSNLLGSLMPKRKFLAQYGGPNKTCVIVSSAGAMKSSKLGSFIDSHDIVLRFNNAPTKTYEEDVGTKTTIRILNSQVVSKPEFDFIHAPIFQNISIGIWDPGKYNASLEDWLSNPDFDLFTNYKTAMMRNSKADIHIIDPRSIWRLWNALQDFTKENDLRKNPPTSGFIGIALLLPLCQQVHIVEYIPSTRLTSNCHYYDHEINSACTFGEWHPLAAEKLMTYSMNVASDFSVFQKGILKIERKGKDQCNK